MIEVIRDFKEAKNAKVQLVKFQGKEWVYKKESSLATTLEIKFQALLSSLKLESLQTISPEGFSPDELLQEYLREGTLDLSDSTKHYKRLGDVLAQVHGQEFNSPTVIDSNGGENNIEWAELISPILTDVGKKLAIALSSSEAHQVNEYLCSFFDSYIPQYTYIHGDIHTANVLLKGNDVVLFDKSNRMWRSSPYFDLAVLVINLPNDTLIDINDIEYEADERLWRSFQEGYGTIDINVLKAFSVLVAGSRATNKNEPYNLSVIRKIAC